MTPPGSAFDAGTAARSPRVVDPLLPLVVAAVVALAGCTDEPGGDTAAGAEETGAADAGAVFASAGRVELEEADSALISSIQGFEVGPDGRMAVADQQTDRVLVFAPDGRREAALGGEGEGPGELENPLDAAFAPDGGLWVVQQGGSRMSRFASDLAYDTAFQVEDGLYPEAVEILAERPIVYINRNQPGARSLRIYSPGGRAVKTFHPRRPEYREVPYWSAPARRLLAVSESHVVAGGNMLYPLVVYGRDGAFRDSIGTPPPSWIQPPKPEPGALAPPNQMRKYQEWLRTFTTIDEIAVYRDSLLVVAHEKLDPEVLAYEEAVYRADVYDLASTRKLAEDVRLPGRLLAGGEHVHVLVGSPPQRWAVERFRIAAGGGGP